MAFFVTFDTSLIPREGDNDRSIQFTPCSSPSPSPAFYHRQNRGRNQAQILITYRELQDSEATFWWYYRYSYTHQMPQHVKRSMPGDSDYTVSTAQQYIGTAPAKTLRRSMHRVVQCATPSATTGLAQEQAHGSVESSEHFIPAKSSPQLSSSGLPPSVERASLDAEAAGRLRVQEVLRFAGLPPLPGSHDSARLIESIKRDEEAEADELAAWGQSLLSVGASPAHSEAILMASKEVKTMIKDMERPMSLQSRKRLSAWDQELLGPVGYGEKLAQGPAREAEVVLSAPMTRMDSVKGHIEEGEQSGETGEMVKLAPLAYNTGPSSAITSDTVDQIQSKTSARHPQLASLNTPALPAAKGRRSPNRVHFALQIPTETEGTIPEVDGAYEYIEASMPSDLSNGGRKGHTPTSSAGTEIYFSPIDATRSHVFLSSPQPSPPATPAEGHVGIPKSVPDAPKKNQPLAQAASGRKARSPVEIATARLQELVLESEGEDQEHEDDKVSLTLRQVDQLSLALARCPLVTKHVQRPFFDSRSAIAKAATTSDGDSLLSDATTLVADGSTAAPPTPPLSELSDEAEEVGGIALLDLRDPKAPIRSASSGPFKAGKVTQLSLPPGMSNAARLRFKPAKHPAGESRIVLQVMESVVDRKSGRLAFTLLSETDVSHAFIRTALIEVASATGVSLDEVEIQTPTASSHPSSSGSARDSSISGEIDWANLDSPTITPPAASPTRPSSPSSDLFPELISALDCLRPETCTMQTLTLLSHLSSLKRHHHTFLLLQPTRYHEDGMLAGLKVPYASQSLQERFGEPGSSFHMGKVTGAPQEEPRGFFSMQGSVFRTAIVASVAKHMKDGEEFEMLIDLSATGEEDVVRNCRCRCVPLRKVEDGKVDMWVCMVGGEFDLPVY